MNHSNISRRNFVSLSLLAGLGAGASLVGCAPKASPTQGAELGDTGSAPYPQIDLCGRPSMSEIELSSVEAEPITTFDAEETYDVVVVGAGASGLPAAVAAAEAGATVCVLQKEPSPASQGASCCYINRENTDELAIAHLLRHMSDNGCGRGSWELNRAWAENCTEALDWFMGHLTEAGYQKDEDFKHFPIAKFDYPEGSANLNVYIFPKNVGGAIERLAESTGGQYELKTETPAVQLIVEDGTVTGAYAKNAEGQIIRVNATKGVILASGDYQNNDAMVEKYLPDAAMFSRKQINKTGDGQLMGMMVGAKMQYIGHTKMVHSNTTAGFSRLMQSGTMLAVNELGQRFCAEDRIFSVRNNIARSQPNGVWISVLDSKDPIAHESLEEKDQIQSDFSKLDAATPEEGVFKADTLEELAGVLDIPADAFLETIERYNELCASGGDLDFGKSTTCMISVDQPPFYAIRRSYCISAITSGLEVTAENQVLDTEGAPIPGLYAVGNCSGPFYGSPDYPMDIPGLSVSRAITSGYIAGKTLAAM